MQVEKKKLKVLCLHGHQTNSTIMQLQTKEWRNIFKNELQFEYINGKHKLTADEVIDVRVKKLLEAGQDAYTWLKFLTSDYYENVLSDLSYIADHINQNGPYDGVIGFSQGGTVFHTFLQLVFENKIQINSLPKFVIYICSPLQGPAFSIPQLNIPSLHYVSYQDVDLYDRQLITSIFYKNPIVINHSYGHRVPRLSPSEVEKIKTFIMQAVSAKQQNPDKIQQTPKL
ncbi:serine hydrolase (macronuclear) [Tetrahymena thermophila SB210]|uniref:Serine hydrolase n=1 Tax=Tetrahymena thermophila (strain SB210) TaxID=312017 RepID=Q23C26_TETTS|nr:serine hydrolase [Tetrahymena thermophila SB210]EAR93942.1 serine hydrolase [Tetrahymena thermophila SB210]|eukprot:XP_001014187.1 serine hydrolase [Tetrahymena thermophila SB210]